MYSKRWCSFHQHGSKYNAQTLSKEFLIQSDTTEESLGLSFLGTRDPSVSGEILAWSFTLVISKPKCLGRYLPLDMCLIDGVQEIHFLHIPASPVITVQRRL